ncbi:sensor histidine kinase [Geomonas anaerohicana]|uniref:histidine kinase n=1 Tax=Geomonas anaerohicana TaxID=2798583 RepID=A0ABS0YDM7_9BACT|nr:response regulator [Geomonas anaerohicana]MBJ6750269.1 response regulator [Geomonas anaerohicana]
MKDEVREGAGVSMLYVEDEADARQMVTRMLAMNYPNLIVYGADNGLQALELYRQYIPEIVMTDINMPVMDGIRMSREIKAINPEVRIIAVTAHSDTSYLLSAIEIGVHHYVLKPLNYQELFTVLDKVLEQMELKRLVSEQHRRLAQSERQLAAGQRIAHLGSWQREPDAEGMDWSDEMYRICGLEPGAVPASYHAFLERFHTDDRDDIAASMQSAQDPQHQPEHRFVRVVRPDGSYRIVRLDVEGVREGDHAAGVIGTCHDVTELKQAEQQVRSLTEELERRVLQRTSLLQATVSELENFSYFVSHDLRAPVARLEGFCTALLEDCGACGHANCRQYAERSANVVQQIKQIMDAFNSLTHLARCALTIRDTDMSRLARDIAHALSAEAPERRVEFVIAEGARVKGDPELLGKALRHLLENAWKFTSRTERGRIEFGWTDRHDVRTYFVRDNGVGFNMKYAQMLFKPFQTIHAPEEFGWTGTGIGLATAHSIVLRHGGRMWAEGEVGQGATFYFTLEPNPESGSYLKET